jgi:spermidine/putrescine transport system substrate-binding protein
VTALCGGDALQRRLDRVGVAWLHRQRHIDDPAKGECMSRHPKERLSVPRGLSRRDFLLRAGAAGIALPSLSAILAACSDSTSTSGGTTGGGAVDLVSPKNPATLPLFDDVPAIADDLPLEAGPLRIYNWDDYVYKKVLKQFEEQFGVTIEYTQFTGMSEAISKIQNGSIEWDVFFPTVENVSKLVSAKQVQPLSKTYLPNLSNVWPYLQDAWYDQGDRYTVPYLTWKTGIGYRRDFVDDPATLDQPFDIFWDPKYTGKVGLLDEYRETIGMALLRDGGTDFNSTDQAEVAAAVDSLVELIGLVNVEIGPGDYQKLAEGTSHLRYSWSGNMNYARWYLPKGTSVDVLGYYYPPTGGWEVANDVMVVNAQAQNPVLAHTFLNFLMDVDVGLTNFGYEGFQPPFQGVDEEQFRKAGYVPENLASTLVVESDFAAGQPVLALPAEIDQVWQDEWSRFKAGVTS